jgi:hypothetical protein
MKGNLAWLAGVGATGKNTTLDGAAPPSVSPIFILFNGDS